MPTQRDYAIATLLGENATDTPQGMAGVLDTIFNRTAHPGDYSATGPSIQQIVTAGNGSQYNNWIPGNNAYGITQRGLQGRDSMKPGERAAYDQAAKVFDDYVAGNNGYRGMTQGATYYQTPEYADKGTWQNKFYGKDNSNWVDVGQHRYTGPQNTFYKDQNAFYQAHPELGMMTSQQAPSPGTDGFGNGFNVAGDAGNGSIGSSGKIPAWLGPALGYDSSGSASGTIGDPNFGAGITPYAPVTPTSFAGSFAAGGGQVDPAVTAAYQNIFGRNPDAGGLQAGESFLTHGGLGDYITQLLGSQEAKQNASGGSLPGLQDLLSTIQNTPGVQGNFNLPQLPGVSGTGGLPSTDVSTQGPGATTPTIPAFNSADPIGSLYQAILHRPGDASGIQNFDAQLNGGRMDLNQIAQTLAGSDEAKTLGPGITVPTFSNADTVYARTFGRLADTAGAQNFDAQINAGLPQNILEAQLLGSQEAQNRGPDQLAQLVNNYNTSYGIDTGSAARLVPYAQEFQQATGRAMDVPTQQVWASQLNAGASPAILEAGLLGAPEAIQARTGSLDDLTNQFKAKYGLTPEQVNTLAPAASEFQSVLGRPVDVPTLQNWASQNTAMPFLQAQILGSQEAQTRGPDVLAPLVNQFTQQYGFNPTQALTTLAPLASEFTQALGRAPDVPTLQTWANASAQGQGLGQLTAGLLQAPEVQARTGGQGTLFQQFGSQYGMNPADYLTSLQPKAPAYVAPGISDPFGFSNLNVSGYNPNTGGGFGASDGTISAPGIQSLPGSGGDGGSAFVGTPSGSDAQVFASFNPQDSENNFLNAQMTAHAAQQAAGQAPEATNSNIWNANLNTAGQQMQAQQAAQNRTNMANMGMLGPALGGFSNVGTYVAPGSYNYTPQGLFGAPTLFNAPSLGGMFGASSMGTGSFH